MKKILAILLTVCMVVCMIPGAAFAGTVTSWNAQTAVADIDYKLVDTNNDNNADLVEIYTNLGLAHYFSNLTTNNCDAKLINNLDMSKQNSSAMTWDINTSNYAKTFDGNGKSITGLDNPLIASIVNGGVVKDLTISNSKITKSIGSNETIGFITGTNAGMISGCNAGGTVSATVNSSSEISVGAITGTNSGTIENCTGNALTYTGADTKHLDIGLIAGKIEGGTITGCTVGSISEGTLGSGATLHKGTIAGCVHENATVTSTDSRSTEAPVGNIENDKTLTINSSRLDGAIGNGNSIIKGRNSTFSTVTAKNAEFSINSSVNKLNITGSGDNILILDNATISELNLLGSSSEPKLNILAGSDNRISTINCETAKPTVNRNTSGKLIVDTVTNKGTNFYTTNIANSPEKYTTNIFGENVIVSTSSIGDNANAVYTYKAVAQAEFAGVKYATVKEAFEKAAKVGGTVKLIGTTGIATSLDYSAAAVALNISKDVILDVNGHEFSIKGTFDCIGNLIIKDTVATVNQKLVTIDNNITINKLAEKAGLQSTFI